MRFPSQAQKKKRKFRFQIEDLDIIFQRLPSQAKKKREIPFSNRRYWHYFPEKPKKTRKSRFQMRFPSQAQKKHGNSVFKQKILALFSRGSHHKPNKTTEIPFSKRRYWHYFPEVPITSPKKGNPVFKQKILALFSRKAQKDTEIPFSNEVPITSPKKNTEILFSNRRYWHYFPEKPKKTRKSGFQMRFPPQAQKKHGNSVFKQKILILFSRGCHHKPKK